VLGVKHGIGNCLVFDHLEEFYPEGVALFKEMKAKHDIVLPKGVCDSLREEDFNTMIRVAMGMEPLWENALGKDWRKTITAEKLRSIYNKI
jgi:3-deoxy-alpha-D-manno-octulosonate 8-oxidase